MTAACISCAVLTRVSATPAGTITDVGPDTSVTSAPRRRAASAMAYPILPEERLER
jgi:hypothetical protein